MIKGIECIDMPGMGGMGVHYVNGTNVNDDKLNPLAPEAVVRQASLTVQAIQSRK